MNARTRISLLVGAAGLAALALFVRGKTRQAVRLNPPSGRFIHVDGVRLHYVERGQGRPVVLLHGSGTMVQDFELSGVLELTAARYRVVAFDRPGYGYSSRPAGRSWAAADQAELFAQAFRQLGLERPVVVGHSWGALIALALALRHPDSVRSLVLLSGYYFPRLRLGVPLLTPILWPAFLRRLFSPGPVPRRFARFPTWLALRPSQLRASLAEALLTLPAAAAFRRRYRELRTPTFILAGAEDRHVSAEQSVRLHEALPGSELRLVSGMGHMVHHFAPRKVLAAIEAAARAA